MAAFDLASVLKDAGAQMGTNKEQIEYIRITKLHPAPDNFYEMTGIDELCANIELIGLQQPLRVRADAENAGEYIIVSGHRRWTALCRLVNEGHDQYLDAPCIVEAPASSAELQELRLIYANADTRKMTNAETAKQAARVEELLYKLKEQGVDFPGRMRDHVAEACKISKSKLQRLKQIQKGLAPDIAAAYYDTGKLSEGAALELSKLPIDDQRYIIDTTVDKPGIEYLRDYSVTARAALLQRFREMPCPADGGCCTNCDNIFRKVFVNGYEGYSYCARDKHGCCNSCPELATCSKSCEFVEVKKADLKAKAKDQKAQEKAAQAAADAPKIELIRNLWARMAEALDRNGLTYSQMAGKASLRAVPSVAIRELLNNPLTAKISADSYLPFGLTASLSNIETLIRIADTLNCSIDYLLGRDTPAASATQPATPRWHTEAPPKDGMYIVQYEDKVVCFGAPLIEPATWKGGKWRGLPLSAEHIRWTEIPED